MAAPKKLKDQAYNQLKMKILNNGIQDGEYLEEKKLCEMMGISRTPIREAINMLEQEDLVQTIPHKGIFVTTMSVQAIKELFQTRYVLEPIALQSGYMNLDHDVLLEYKEKLKDGLSNKDYVTLHLLDYEFHNYLHSGTNNRYINRFLNHISDNFQRVRTQPFYTELRTEGGAQEHLTLIDLIIEGNIEEACEFLKTHISNTEKYYFKSLIGT